MFKEEDPRTCTKCGKTKPLSEFYPIKKNNRHERKCKMCRIGLNKKWLAEHPERHAEYRKASNKRQNKKRNTPEGYRKAFLTKRAWQSENAQKLKAIRIVEKLRKRGAIIKPAHCELCDRSEILYAFHEDYSKPLEIRWLCPKHAAKRRVEKGWKSKRWPLTTSEGVVSSQTPTPEESICQ